MVETSHQLAATTPEAVMADFRADVEQTPSSDAGAGSQDASSDAGEPSASEAEDSDSAEEVAAEGAHE